MKLLRFINNALARVEGWLIVIFLGLMVASTLVQVILRAFYTHGQMQWANFMLGQVDWAVPFARLLVLWLTFLGASLVTGDSKHIKIDLLSSLLPRKSLPFRELVLSIACAVICAFLLKASLDYVALEMSFGGHLFLRIPTWVGQLILPAGFSLILFRFLLRGLEQLLEIFRGVET
ncbi:MAG: TRAP transporter small permease subunit [Desulfatiglandales bacterium]